MYEVNEIYRQVMNLMEKLNKYRHNKCTCFYTEHKGALKGLGDLKLCESCALPFTITSNPYWQPKAGVLDSALHHHQSIKDH